jgi:long-chain acyl-CoA synthetase
VNQATIQEQKKFKQCYESMHTNGTLLPVGHLLHRIARLNPHHTALIHENRTITYRSLYGCALMFSKVLTDRGVKPRDRVILLFENSLEFYAAYFGILQIGAVVVPLNIFLQDREIAHVLADAQPSCVVASSTFVDRIRALENGTNMRILTEHDIIIHDSVFQSASHVSLFSLDPDELTVLLYTSGTTGLPKGVMLSSNNIMTNIAQGYARFPLVGQERILGVLPLFHSFAQTASIWIPFFLGYTVILVSKIDRHCITRSLANEPTIFVGVPALYGLLCLMRTADLASIRLFVSGGDALVPRIASAFALLYRRKICSGYGLTETSPLVAVSFDDIMQPSNAVGKPLHGIVYAFKDEHGNDVPNGTIGELWLSGGNIMLGYYNAPEMTQQVITNGWFRTGDLAYLDQKGVLIIAGRTKDLIINKGFNIYPQEIESIIASHLDVIRVGVIGSPDPLGGEIPIAYVQVKNLTPTISKELRDLCMKNLASYKVPRDFIISTDELPTTATGKVNKKQLRSQNAEANDTQR